MIYSGNEMLNTGVAFNIGKRIANVAKWIGKAETGGRVAIGLSVVSAALTLSQTCNINDLEDCAKKTVIETGGVLGGLAGGEFGFFVGALILASGAVVSLPVTIIVLGTTTIIGGIAGTAIGKSTLDYIYDIINADDFFFELENKINNDVRDEIFDTINSGKFNNINVNNVF